MLLSFRAKFAECGGKTIQFENLELTVKRKSRKSRQPVKASNGRWRAVLALQLPLVSRAQNAMQRTCDHAHENRGDETRATICLACSDLTFTTRANNIQEGHIGPLVSRISLPTQPYPVPHAHTCKIGIARQLMLSRAHPRLSHCFSNRCRTSCRPSAALRQLELARDAASIRRRRRPGGR